jgi:hypothetical protein
MDRRQFLKRSFAVGAVSAWSGCTAVLDRDGPDASSTRTPRRSDETPAVTAETTSPPAETATGAPLDPPVSRHGVSFDTVVHAVDDFGCDPTGSDPIDDAIEEAYGDGTLLVFPPGEYLVTDQHVWDRGVEGFGILGLGDDRRDVQFVFPAGNAGAPDPDDYQFLWVQSGRDHLLENVTVQQTDDKVTSVGTKFVLEDGLRIVDVEMAGFNPNTELHGPSYGVIAHVTDPDGVGIIRRFVCVGGGVVASYPRRKTPIGAFHDHRGELRIEDAHVEESGSHSVYVSRTRGCVRIEGGLFRNNDNTNLRVSGGGHPTKRSWVKDVRIEVDVDEARHLPPGEQYEEIRGIWVESGGEYEYGHEDLLLENVDAVVRSNGESHDLPLLLVEHNHGSVTVRNSRFRSRVEVVEPIDVRSPSGSMDFERTDVTLDAVRVECTARRVHDEEAAISVSGRPGSSVRRTRVALEEGWVDGVHVSSSDGFVGADLQIAVRPRDAWAFHSRSEQRAGTNAGVVVVDSEDCVLRNVSADVPGAATRFRDSTVDTTGM